MPRFPAGRRTYFADGTPALEVPLVSVPIPEPTSELAPARPRRARKVVRHRTIAAATIDPSTAWRGVDSPWCSTDDVEDDVEGADDADEQLTIPSSTGDWWDGYLADVARREKEFYARVGITPGA